MIGRSVTGVFRCLAVIGALWAGSLAIGAPLAAADPSFLASGQSAEAAIDVLEAQGYNVQINWVSGFDTKPLSQCWITNVNNPGHEAPTDGTFVTVYVDVVCPNGDDGGSFGVGIGFG
ncbi:hypothetical protein TUM20983_03740 [Mycobacterium antarcticum]|nr:hypothetical protein TUM20983_03740 [Mycolicibacterium sp. TUM20983]GLP78978.1 hypothetical protein TUM20984_03980 [Mycolicibacterium sp. TUM20984]